MPRACQAREREFKSLQRKEERTAAKLSQLEQEHAKQLALSDDVGNTLVMISERRMGFGIHPNAGIAQELSEAVDLSLKVICVRFGEFGVAESAPYIVPPAQSLGVAQGRARHRLAGVFSPPHNSRRNRVSRRVA